MPSAVSGRWKHSTIGFNPGRAPSWHCWDESGCQPAQRSVAFSPCWIRVPSSRCAPSCLQDLLARPLAKEEQPGGLWDRQGNHFLVFDIDGTREAARQRALPNTQDRPAPQRRLRPLCAPGYTGRKRGEVVRTRTTVLQAQTHQWLAPFGNPGNGEYRVELRRAVAIIGGYLKAHHHPAERALLRLDGQYGTGAVLT